MTQKTQRQQPLVFFFATRGGGYTVEATTSLSLSLSLCLSLTLCTTFLQSNIDNNLHISMKICALSHIYTYMTFRHIYISVLPIGRNRSGPVL